MTEYIITHEVNGGEYCDTTIIETPLNVSQINDYTIKIGKTIITFAEQIDNIYTGDYK